MTLTSRPRWSAQLIGLVLLLLSACRERSSSPAVQSPNPAPTVGPRPNTTAPAAPSVVEASPAGAPSLPSSPTSTLAGNEHTEKAFSAKEALQILVDSRFASITPSDAKQKLAQFGEVRETPIDAAGAVDICMTASSPRIVTSYVRDSVGAWAFMKASATVATPEVSDADAIYKDYESALRRRFGKPVWVNDNGPPPPIKGWSVGDGVLEISLAQRTNEIQGAVVELELVEPQGEAE
jgi:hypothetical protein